MKRVLIFDSGVGGLSVLDAIARAGLGVELNYCADTAWLPYGAKADAEVAARVPLLLQSVAGKWDIDLVVIACNTASTIALEGARALLRQPIVGVVPPIKPAAAASQSGTIGLLATPATVRRAYTRALITQFAADKTVVSVGATALVEAAEAKLRGRTPDRAVIAATLEEMFAAPGGENIDVVALSCTHFPLLLEELEAAAPRAVKWIDSGAAIARRVRDLLQPSEGVARAARAAFTDLQSAQQLQPAFAQRGFSELLHLQPEAPFSLLGAVAF